MKANKNTYSFVLYLLSGHAVTDNDRFIFDIPKIEGEENGYVESRKDK